MNPAHFHLILNHIPVLGGVMTLFLVVIATRKRSEPWLAKRAFYWMVFIGLITVPVYLTGEPAEDIIEKILGDGIEPFVEPHEHWGLYNLIATEALALLSLLGIFLYRRTQRAHPQLWRVVALLALVNAGIGLQTANLGGKIRHTEIRSQVPGTSGAETPLESGDQGENEDD